jgi:hypothetical protein
MKKIKSAAFLLTAALVAAAITGCGGSSTKTVDMSQQPDQGQPAQGQPGARMDRGSMGKVVTLDGNQLTVILADMPERSEKEMPERSPDETLPPEGNTPPGGAVSPDGQDGQPPAEGTPPAGENEQPGQGGREIEFTGEEVTYTLSGDVTISKGMGENTTEIDLSDMESGDVIRFTTSTGEDGNERIDSIVIME